MRIKTLLGCFALILALVFAIPANVSAASGDKVVTPGILAAAGIKSGDIFTIYYNADGSISKIVKGSPNGIKIDSQINEMPTRVSPMSSPDRYTINSPISSGAYDRGGVTYQTSLIYYAASISANCAVAFGGYNMTLNYFTGQYFGPYTSTTNVNYSFRASLDNWRYEVYNDGPNTLYIAGSAYIYY
jgi:hypothetical protein